MLHCFWNDSLLVGSYYCFVVGEPGLETKALARGVLANSHLLRSCDFFISRRSTVHYNRILFVRGTKVAILVGLLTPR
jgi:hypothetical protein